MLRTELPGGEIYIPTPWPRECPAQSHSSLALVSDCLLFSSIMGSPLSTLRSRLQGSKPEKPKTHHEAAPPTQQDLRSFIQHLITSFTNEIGYTPPTTTENDSLWKAMRSYADQTGISYEEGSHSWKCFKMGYIYPVVSNLSTVIYHECSCNI